MKNSNGLSVSYAFPLYANYRAAQALFDPPELIRFF